MGKVATSPLPPRGSHPLQSGKQTQKWPINGQGGYVTPAASRIPSASERGAKSEVAHKWARWLRHPCRLGDPHRFGAGGKFRSGPFMGHLADFAPRSEAEGIPTASGGRGNVSHLAHLWATSGRGDIGTLPIYGPLLILPPALKRMGSPRRQG